MLTQANLAYTFSILLGATLILPVAIFLAAHSLRNRYWSLLGLFAGVAAGWGMHYAVQEVLIAFRIAAAIDCEARMEAWATDSGPAVAMMMGWVFPLVQIVVSWFVVDIVAPPIARSRVWRRFPMLRLATKAVLLACVLWMLWLPPVPWSPQAQETAVSQQPLHCA